MVSTALKRSWLRQIYGAAGGTFLSRLNAANAASVAVSASGTGQVTSTSANGRSTTFAAASTSGVSTQHDISELAGEMIDLYERSVLALVAGGIAVPSDAQILTQMLSELYAAFSSTPDFSTFRYGYS